MLGTCLLLAGCDQYMGASDGISPVAGDAPRQNVAMQTADPKAGYRNYPNPGSSGVRAAGVIDQYRAGTPVVSPSSGEEAESEEED